MPTIEVVRDAPQKSIAPVDESVVIPARVREAAERANQYYKSEPTPEEKAAADAETARAVEAQAAAEAAQATPKPKPKKAAKPAASAEPEPPKQVDPPQPPDHNNVNEAQWEHRYHSMKGRFDASQQTIGSMQEQMTQLGDELMRTQALIQNRPALPQRQAAPPQSIITDADKEAFGDDLINLARRAAQETMGPEIDAVKQENARLRNKMQQDAQMGVGQLLDRDIPNWREINRDPRFIQWLRLPDIYSRKPRKAMLSEAYQAADAPLVKAFFEGFIRDEAVTGHDDLTPQSEPQDGTPAPQRQAAVPLSSLAAPGRAKPASGDTPGPADKPTFTRTQIAKFYSDVRKGLYAGREAEKTQQEKQIFAAQADGRVR